MTIEEVIRNLKLYIDLSWFHECNEWFKIVFILYHFIELILLLKSQIFYYIR